MTFPILVDPSIPAFMGIPQTKNEVEVALNRLFELNRIADSHSCIRLVSNPKFQLTIYESGCFPFYQHLSDLFDRTGWSGVFDPALVGLILNAFVERVVSIADFTVANDMICDTMELVPPQAHLDAFPTLKAGLEELLVFFCSAVINNDAWADRTAIALSSPSLHSPTIQINCDVPLVEPPIANGSVTAFTADEVLSVVCTQADIYGLVNSVEVWEEAESDCELSFAITSRAFQLRVAAGEQADAITLRPFSLGSHFRESLGHAQSLGNAPYAQATLDTCARVLADILLPDDHPFYTSAGSGVQRIRESDDARAHRVHVSKGGIGVRLMYWRLPGDTIEFSNAAPKKNAIIFE